MVPPAVEHAATHRALVLVAALLRYFQRARILDIDTQPDAADVLRVEEVSRQELKRLRRCAFPPVLLPEQTVPDLELLHIRHGLEVHNLADDLSAGVDHHQPAEILAPAAAPREIIA